MCRLDLFGTGALAHSLAALSGVLAPKVINPESLYQRLKLHFASIRETAKPGDFMIATATEVMDELAKRGISQPRAMLTDAQRGRLRKYEER